MMAREAHPRLIPTWAAALGLLAAVGCRTGPARRPAAPAPPTDFIRSYVGQSAILRHAGDEKKWAVDRNATVRSGRCDVAVEVKEAAFRKGVVQLRMEYLGQPRIEGERSRCRRTSPEIEVRITGFGSDEPAESVRAAIGRLLLTPETLLAAHGIRFELPLGGEPPLAADRSAVGKEAEMRLAREVTRWPRKLLWIEPAWADPTRKIRHEGNVEFAAIVGPDGRIYGPHVVTPLADPQERQVRRTLTFWRFEPARRGSEPVAARVSEQTVFRIF